MNKEKEKVNDRELKTDICIRRHSIIFLIYQFGYLNVRRQMKI